jgi:hypothetical protein
MEWPFIINAYGITEWNGHSVNISELAYLIAETIIIEYLYGN